MNEEYGAAEHEFSPCSLLTLKLPHLNEDELLQVAFPDQYEPIPFDEFLPTC